MEEVPSCDAHLANCPESLLRVGQQYLDRWHGTDVAHESRKLAELDSWKTMPAIAFENPHEVKLQLCGNSPPRCSGPPGLVRWPETA